MQQPGLNGFTSAMGINPTQQQMITPGSGSANPNANMSAALGSPMNPMGHMAYTDGSSSNNLQNPMAMSYMGSPPGMLTPGNQLSAELKDAMRSFRDSLAFSFQTLNLTLSSLNQTVSTVGTKLGRMTPGDSDLSRNQYVQVNSRGVYLGAMSPNMANYLANNSFGSIFSHYAPANISPLEFYTERARELGLRSSNMAVTAGAGLAEELASYGASMWAGKKMLGAMGIGTKGMLGEMGAWMLGSPVGTAATVALGYITDPIIEYATRHNRDVAAMRRMSPRIGMGFDLRQSQLAIGGLERLALSDTLNSNSLQPRMGLEGFKEMTMMGLQANMFQGHNAKDLLQQVETASHVVKFLMGVMGSKDVRESMTVLKQLKDMGVNAFNSKGFIHSLGMDAFGYGRALGVDSGSLIETAANMSIAAYGQFGNPAFVGMRPAMRNLAYMQEMEKRGLMSAADIAAGGGVQNMAARMTSVSAGMMNSWSVGMPILYAGWDGKTGFDPSKFNNAFQSGGYFGALQAATANMLNGGINKITHAMMNKNNIMASAAKAGNGKMLDQATKDMLEAYILNTPGMQDWTAPLEERISNAAYTIMRIAPTQFGVEVDAATAKALARDILQPQISTRLEANKMRQEQIGLMEYVTASRGFGRAWESKFEKIEKTQARWHEGLIGSAARTLADKTANMFDYVHGNPWLESKLKLSSKNISTYNWAKKAIKDDDRVAMSGEDFIMAVNRQKDPDSIFHGFARAINRDINYAEDLIAYNSFVDTYQFYSDMMDPKKRMSDLDFMTKYADELGSATIDDFTKRMRDKSYYNNKDRSRYGKLDGMIRSGDPHSIFTLAGAAFKDYNSSTAAKQKAQWEAEYQSLFGNVKNVFKDNSLTGGLLDPNAVEGKKVFKDRLSADDAYFKVLNSGMSNVFTDEVLKKLNTLDEDARAYAMARMVQNHTVADAYDGGRGSYTEAILRGNKSTTMNKAAQTFGVVSNKFQREMYQGMRKIDINKMNDMELFRKAGISVSDIHELVSDSDEEGLDRLVNSLINLGFENQGDLRKLDASTISKYFKPLNKTERNIAHKFFNSAGTGKELIELIGSSAYTDSRWTDAKNIDLESTKQTSMRNLAKQGLRWSLGQVTSTLVGNGFSDVLRSIGINMDGKDAIEGATNLSDLLEDMLKRGVKMDYTAHSAAKLNHHLRTLSNDQLDSYFGLKAGTITDKTRHDYIRDAALGVIQTTKAEQEESKQQALGKQLSAVDTAVKQTHEGPALRVEEVSILTRIRGDVKSSTANLANLPASITGPMGRFGMHYD